MLARPNCAVCINCKSNRKTSKRSKKVCLYQLQNITPIDLKSSRLRKMLKKDNVANATKTKALESLWKIPPQTIKRPRIQRRVESRFDQHDPLRSTSLQAALAANDVRAAIIIQRVWQTYRRVEKFRAWVRLAMNTDAGRNKLATIIASKFWRRVQCMHEYQTIRKAVLDLQNFYRLCHARKRAMRRALLKLRISLNDVLGQEWRLHRIVTAVENNGRARDRKRIQLATDYLISQGHGQNMSVSGVLRLCHDLKKTKKSLRSKKKKQMKKWIQQRPESWKEALEKDNNTSMLSPTSPTSRWFGRQRKVRARLMKEENQYRIDRDQELVKRREQKLKDKEEDERDLMAHEEKLRRRLLNDEAESSFPWPKK